MVDLRFRAPPASPQPPPSFLFAAFDGLVAKVGASLPAERMLALHRAFERRTGAFGPNDPWFETRSRAFWDDALTRQRVWAPCDDALQPAERLWTMALGRAHRGLFRSRRDDGRLVLVDVLGGAELLVSDLDEGSRDALSSTTGLFDGTVVALASPVRTALLPGAIFHPEEADGAIGDVVTAARARGMADGALLDALLRMELSFRTLSRVKPGYAYRPGALGG
jgi:hypothetical protein